MQIITETSNWYMKILIIFSLPLCLLGKHNKKWRKGRRLGEREGKSSSYTCDSSSPATPTEPIFAASMVMSAIRSSLSQMREGDLLLICCCCCSVAKSCPTLCNPVDYCLPGSSVHGISQARLLEWVAISFSRRSSWPRDQTQVSYTAGGLLHCRQILSWVSHQRGVLSHFSHVQPYAIRWIARSPQASLSMEFPRQEYWSGLPCPSPEDLPDSGIEPMSLLFPALAGGFFTTSTTWEGPSHQGTRRLQKHLSLRQAGAGAGGEGSTRNRSQIVMLLPGDAHNTPTKCSSKNWNTLGDDLVTDRIQELLSHLFAMKYEMQSNVIRS